MLKIADMSGTELLFVQMYVRALKRDYDLLKTVIELMHPEKLAISSILTATELALKLDQLSNDVGTKLADVADKQRFRHVKSLPWPPVDGLADLFSLSFFKVVTKKNGMKAKEAGWFSGEPDNWAVILEEPVSGMPHNMTSNLPEAFFTDLTKAAKKLFGISFFAEMFDQFKHQNPNVWPIPEEYDGYDDFDDEDDS